MLRFGVSHYLQMVGHVLDALPYEGCGLLAGPATEQANDIDTAGGANGITSSTSVAATVEACYPCRNQAQSAKLYTVDPIDILAADRDADARGLALMGVFHSHTHTDAYPSPTDVAQAPDPAWHYVLVSLRHGIPVVRSYLIRGGEITEEPVVVEPR